MGERRVGVVPAAGRATRLGGVPKVLVEVGGKPLLAHALENLARLGAQKAVVVVSPGAGRVRASARAWAPEGLEVGFCVQPKPTGLADAVLAARGELGKVFCVVLGDDFTRARNLEAMARALTRHPRALVVEGCVWEEDARALARTCRLSLGQGGRVLVIEEKPAQPAPGYRGIGVYFMRRAFLRVLEEAPRNPRTGERELTDAIGLAARRGLARAVPLDGVNVNINTPQDLARARAIAGK